MVPIFSSKGEVAITDNPNDDLVFSFKPHKDYDSPLFVVRAASPGEMADKLKAIEEVALWGLAANADTALKAQWNLSKGLGGAEPVQNPSATPQGSGGGQGYQNRQNGGQRPPQGGGGRKTIDPPNGVTAPECKHGPMSLFPEGKFGPFWACKAPRDAPDKDAGCKIQKYQGPPLA